MGEPGNTGRKNKAASMPMRSEENWKNSMDLEAIAKIIELLTTRGERADSSIERFLDLMEIYKKE